MSQSSPTLSLPYIQPSQAQKHVTHNEALRILDAAFQLRVLAADLTDPPASPAEGDRYIPAPGPTGDWAGHGGDIAIYADAQWQFFEAQEGWRADVIPTGQTLRFNGSIWDTPMPALQNLPELGVNTTADATNRLAVASDATLLTHNGDDHQLKVNKANATDTAGLLFQTGFSGRAELGTTGDDNLHLKISPDGSIWHEAMLVDAAGTVSFPSGGVRALLTADRTYYVDGTNGDDSNDGLSAGAGAFATIGAAMSTVQKIDCGGHQVTVQVASGTYAELVVIPPLLNGTGSVIGDETAPSNCVISNASGISVTSKANADQWTISGFKTAGNANGVESRGWLRVGRWDCGNGGTFQFRANSQAILWFEDDYTISAGAAEHMRAANGGVIVQFSHTVTLSGTPNFSTGYCRSQNGGFVRSTGMTFSGSTTGKRYTAESQSGINTDGGGATYFPGDVAGTTSTGGVYT